LERTIEILLFSANEWVFERERVASLRQIVPILD
jgi:hypothetical protein